MATVSAGLQAALDRFRAGDPAAALGMALELAGQGDGEPALRLAGLCFVALGQAEQLLALVQLVHGNGLSAPSFLRTVLEEALQAGLTDALVRLESAIPLQHMGHILALYYAGCARMVTGDVGGALAAFDRFRRSVHHYFPLVPFGTDDDLNIVFRQATLVVPPDEVERRLALPFSTESARQDFQFENPPSSDAEALFFACADSRYVARFAGRFLAALDQPGRAVHLHVVNPDAASSHALAIARAGLRHLHLSVSTSRDAQYATATAFACARFFVLPEILKRVACPVISMDIDVAALPALGRIAEGAPDFDFACCNTGRREPASVWQASVMVWVPGAATLDFLDRLQRFCLPKLAQPVRINWMLDQAALYSVGHYMKQVAPAFRFAALNEVYGLGLADLVRSLAGDEEKHEIKVQAAGLPPGAGADGDVAFTWTP